MSFPQQHNFMHAITKATTSSSIRIPTASSAHRRHGNYWNSMLFLNTGMRDLTIVVPLSQFRYGNYIYLLCRFNENSLVFFFFYFPHLTTQFEPRNIMCASTKTHFIFTSHTEEDALDIFHSNSLLRLTTLNNLTRNRHGILAYVFVTHTWYRM